MTAASERHVGGSATAGSVVGTSLLLPVTVACGNFMTGLDQSVLLTALPAIGRSLGEAPAALGLLLTAYLAALIVALPLGGWASQRFGARRAYSAAALVFTLASLLCAGAETFWQLVGARMLQGLGGALMGTVGQIVILGSFARNRTLRINTFVSLAAQVAPMVGPLLGGVLTTQLSWRWIFLVNLPIGVAVAAAASRLFPEGTGADRRPFDRKGFVLVGAGTLLFVLGMNGLADRTLPAWTVAAQLLAAVALLAMAVRHGRRAAFPLLDIGLLRIPTFRASLLTGGGLDTVGLTAVMFLLPLMLQIGFGLSAAKAGALTFLAAAGSISARAFLPLLLRRIGFRRLLVWNTPLLAAVVAAFALLHPSTPEWLVAALILVFGVLRSFQWGATGNLAYADVPPESVARFSAMYYLLWQMGVALSIGLASALLALLSAGDATPSLSDFHAAFSAAGLTTLCAVVAYARLRPEDGSAVSGHRANRVPPR